MSNDEYSGCECGHIKFSHRPICTFKDGMDVSCECKRFFPSEPWAGAREAIDQLRDRLAQMEWTDPTGSYTLLRAYKRSLEAMEKSIHDHETMQRRKDQQ